MTRDESNSIDRVKRVGMSAASPVDLLAIGFSRSEMDAMAADGMARRLMQRYQSLRAFAESAPSEVAAIAGLDSFEILRAYALMEIGRRTVKAGKGPAKEVTGVEDVVEHIVERLSYLRMEKRESFYAVLLDTKGSILRIAQVHVGTLDASIVGPREIFREAVREGASSLIVVHNHPSGDPSPSQEDISVTRQLVEIGKMLDIPVLDHVVLGETNFKSFQREGLIF